MISSDDYQWTYLFSLNYEKHRTRPMLFYLLNILYKEINKPDR